MNVTTSTGTLIEVRDGLRFQLKQATSASHARLDAGFAALSLARRDEYRRFLGASAAALLPLERLLERSGVDALVSDWARRRRTGVIVEDLADLATCPAPLPPPPIPLSAAESFGALYVLEGSRLGARFLTRVCAASDDAVVRGATRYLRHGEDERLWPSFVAALEESAAARAAPADCVTGALLAFALFQQAQDAHASVPDMRGA